MQTNEINDNQVENNIRQSANLFILNTIFIDESKKLFYKNILYAKDNNTESIFYDIQTKEGVQITRNTYRKSQDTIFRNDVFNKTELESLNKYSGISQKIFNGEELLEICNLDINYWKAYYLLQSIVKECVDLTEKNLESFNEKWDFIVDGVFQLRDKLKLFNSTTEAIKNISRNLHELVRITREYKVKKEGAEIYIEILTNVLELAKLTVEELKCYIIENINNNWEEDSTQIYMLQLQLFLKRKQIEAPTISTLLNLLDGYSSNAEIDNKEKIILKKSLKKILKKMQN